MLNIFLMFNYNLRGRVPLSNGLLALSGNVLHSLLWFAGNVRFFALFFVLPSLTASGCEKNKIQDGNNQKINVVKLEAADSVCAGVLYDKILGSSNPVLDVKVNGAGQFTTEGLDITTKGAFAELNKFYALSERKVRYRVVFSGDAKAVFRSSEGDFCATIDIPGKRISLATVPVTEKTVSFLSGNREYRVEISHIYQQAGLSIIDVETGDEAVITAVHDGQRDMAQELCKPGSVLECNGTAIVSVLIAVPLCW